jgi:hypothetical protein
MFNRNITKTTALAMVLALTGIIVRNVILPERAASAADTNTRTERAYVVQIKHNWWEHTPQGDTFASGLSHGTTIGAHTVLTHNHFSRPADGAFNETMTFVSADGQAAELAPSDYIVEPIDGGTLLIHLPENLSLSAAPLAERASIDQLGFGDWLTVTYWDDEAGRLTQQDFMIVHVQDGVATLLDFGRRINTGDSGSGAYSEGKLVGNIWSIYTSGDGAPLGAFEVALLPAQVGNSVQAASPWIDGNEMGEGLMGAQ